MLKSLLAATTATLSLVACVKQDEGTPNVDKALPTAAQVSIKLPQTAARTVDSDVVGQLATWYVATRGVTLTFNGGTAWVLTLIHAIVQAPPTTIQGNVYTWGPGSGALDPADYKLVVTANADGTFAYQLSGRSKTQASAQFETVIDGTADPRPGDSKGSGEFLVDFDAGKRVNPVDSGDARGTMDVHYDLAKAHIDLSIMSTDALGQPTAADYAYNAAADGGGDMTFDVSANAGGTALLETLTLRSRWLGTGAGRADARINGGDLGNLQITASECWDTAFGRVFYQDSNNFSPTDGAESACAFATQDLPLPH
ncbi:MAG TPA: hypothetical protein VHW23_24570 [Kofleriaceae bacterium]|jgi:hypothetical protein|nr:hypothetical protein [Kofleriaceae bacterium]